MDLFQLKLKHGHLKAADDPDELGNFYYDNWPALLDKLEEQRFKLFRSDELRLIFYDTYWEELLAFAKDSAEALETHLMNP